MSRFHEAKPAGQGHIDSISEETGTREKGPNVRNEYVEGTPEEAAMLRKIDLHVLPMLWLMYIFNYIDRTSEYVYAPRCHR